MTEISEDEFRVEAAAWLSTNATKRRTRSEDDDVDAEGGLFAENSEEGFSEVERAKKFQAALYDAGFAGLGWPAEYGGQGLPARYQNIFNEEAAGYELPTGIYLIGHGMLGPTILAHGTEELKQRYIRPMLRGDEIWCQLFSEPGAGSDVASLQAKAVRDGDEWVLTGQKVWTSGAHYSDYGIVIARTDPDLPKHRGISMFIVDMHAPGVTVKPLKQITGSSSFNEVFFDEVRIPADHMVGELNEGWRASITVLMNERVAIGAGGGGGSRSALGGVSGLVRAARERGLAGDATVRQELADLYIRQTILGYIGLRIRQAYKAGLPPGPEGSIAKLSGSLLARKMGDVGIRIAGPAGAAWGDDVRAGERWSMGVLSAPASAIAGGTNEIQKNIIGERVLGLPKDPQVDRDLPFRDLKVGTQRD